MAAAYAVMELIEPGETQVRFDTLSGRLTVDKTPDGLYMQWTSPPMRSPLSQ